MQFMGKVAIVTGGASGIGEATAHLLAKGGARVTIADLNMEKAETVAHTICAAGGEAIACRVDVSQEDQVQAMIATTESVFGRLDILHNNAGDLRSEMVSADNSVTTTDLRVWDNFMNINLRGVMLGCKWGIPAMLKQNAGVIVNTSSVGSLGGQEKGIAYNVSKAGVNSLTQYVATAYGKRGIRCNAVAPGFTQTPAAQHASDAIREIYLRHALLPYLGNPEDIAEVVAFLASDAARYITGQVVVVDGGMNAHLSTYSDLHQVWNDSDA